MNRTDADVVRKSDADHVAYFKDMGGCGSLIVEGPTIAAVLRYIAQLEAKTPTTGEPVEGQDTLIVPAATATATLNERFQRSGPYSQHLLELAAQALESQKNDTRTDDEIARDGADFICDTRLDPVTSVRQDPVPTATTDSPADASVAVIAYVLTLTPDDGMEFLSYWNESEFDICRRNWTDAPEACYLGADPFFVPTASAQES